MIERRRVAGLAALALLALLAALSLALDAPSLRLVWTLAAFAAGTAALAALEPARGTAIVLGAGVVFHLLVILSFPPLHQGDSFGYLYDVSPFGGPRSDPPHYPPVYTWLVKLLCSRPTAPLGLATIVGAQHALAIAAALGVRHVVRSAASETSATLAGVALALDGHLAIYAQSIMSETITVAFVVATAVLLVEASARSESRALPLGAGLAAGLAAITRLAAAGWFGVGAIWIAAIGAFAARRRSLGLFLAGALAPIVLVVAFNRVFYGRAVLTASAGRGNLIYRVLYDMPRPTDPDAPPGDSMERARQLAWEERERCWTGPYHRIRDELGWTDAQVDAAFTRWYFEAIRRHPGQFAANTLAYAWGTLHEPESCEYLAGFHDRIRPESPPRWQVAPAGAPPALVSAVNDLALPTRVVVLLLAALAPLLARKEARRLALFALGAVLYFIGISSVTELTVFRYRLPAVPFVVVGAALALDGLSAKIAAMRSGTTTTSQNES
jgi:hypothetical protein